MQAGRIALRAQAQVQVHAVSAEQGVQVPMSDLFGLGRQLLLDRLHLDAQYTAQVTSLRRLIDVLTFE